MKRIIPKSSKVKMEIIKGFSLKDLILAMFLLLMAGLLLFSNLHNRYIYIVCLIVIAILIIIPMNGRKLYEELLAGLRYIFSKKKFVYKYSKSIHKKEEKATKKVDENITLESSDTTQLVTAEEEKEEWQKAQ